MINGNIDIFILSETKLDETFLAARFSLQGFYDPYRFDRDRNGGDVMLYTREDIPSRLIEKKLRNNSEYLFIEIDLRKKKWLVCCSYNLHKKSISTNIDFSRREFDLHSSNRHYSHVTKSRIFKNLNLRKKADRNFRGNFLKNHFRHLKLYSNPPS